jgi:hypothetical protein
MVRFFNAIISGFATWQLFMRAGLSPAAAFVCFLVLFVTLSMITSGLTGGIWNSGLWTTLPVRRFIGLTAEAVLWGFLAWVASGLAVSLNMFNRVGEYLYLLSCPRFSWTAICPTGGSHDEVQHEQD